MVLGPQQRLDVDDPGCRDEQLVRQLADRLRGPIAWYFRPDIRGLDAVPDGPCLFVGNHNGGMLMPDMFILGLALYDRFGLEGLPWGLTHRLALRIPWLGTTLLRLGTVRGTSQNGLRLLRAGRRALVYPGGELDSMRSYRERKQVVFGHRRGYVRLALRADVPIVPVVTAGAHETLVVLSNGRWLARQLGLDKRYNLFAFPLTLSIPWGLWLGVPPPHVPLRTRIRMQLLPPIRFDRAGEEAAQDRAYVEACHRRVHGLMQQTLERLAEGLEIDQELQTP
ncbi:MAG: acyltransferase family protein [Deltaproteobacteria bacterium]|jgi:1-acyl-sn-glycerol-3-phosphate acyltransferase|nr:acyltransferase family protein [Deltaproteobacteria bacterium]MBW2533764.1 acyltransferase family protein [Deltaproteobacteria bacterium]